MIFQGCWDPAPFLDLPMYALYFTAVLEKKSVKDLKARILEFIKMDRNHRQVEFSYSKN